MTRGECKKLARWYAQASLTNPSDSILDSVVTEIERELYMRVAHINPSVVWSSLELTYPAGKENITKNDLSELGSVYRVVQLSLYDSGNASYPAAKYQAILQWNELDRTDAHKESTYAWHWDGTALRLRPIPQEALTLLMRYVPVFVPEADDSSQVFNGNPVLSQWFGDLLALRVAERLCAQRGQDITFLRFEIARAEMALDRYLGTLQDQDVLRWQGFNDKGPSYTLRGG